MEISFVGGSEVFRALYKAGFKPTSTDNGYMVFVTNMSQLQKIAEVAIVLGAISR